MGRVLVNYDCSRVVNEFAEEETDRRILVSEIFGSQEWIFLDMGVVTYDWALKQMLRRLPRRLHHAATQCLNHWHEYCMWINPGTDELIRSLKKRGFGIYLCSNASVRLLDCYDKILPAVDCFDGILYSAEYKCIKPQKEMYQHFFEKFSLKPEECFFIDDLDINIEGSRACGMDGYLFEDGDVQKLSDFLAQFPDPV